MKWFWNWVRRHVERSENAIQKSTPVGRYSDYDHQGITMQITAAVGGRIVTVSRYDRSQDRHRHCTYVIPDSDDFDQTLVKIVTMENLKG